MKDLDRINSDLVEACRMGDLKIVRSLLAIGADPNHFQGNAIWWAVRYGHIQILLSLLETGAVVPESLPVTNAVYRIVGTDSHKNAIIEKIILLWKNPKTRNIAKLLYKNENEDA